MLQYPLPSPAGEGARRADGGKLAGEPEAFSEPNVM